MIDIEWSELPKEVREVLLLVNELVNKRTKSTPDFPMVFIDPVVINMIDNAMNPIRIYYHLPKREDY